MLHPACPCVPFARPQRSYFWYKTSEGDIERRDEGNGFAEIDAGLSCGRFRDTQWMANNRPEWPPKLIDNLKRYTSEVPQGPIVMPPKGSPPSRGEVQF